MAGGNGRVEADAVRSAIAETLDPLRRHIETIDSEIAGLEAELAELRELRRMASKMIHVVEPQETAARKKPRTINSPKTEEARGRMDAIVEWLGANPDAFPDGFAVRDLYQAIGEEIGVGLSAFGGYIHDLAAEGSIRLDRIGGSRGVTKFYKLSATQVKA